MNVWKTLALASTSALVLVVGYQAASAGPAPAPAPSSIDEKQPNMEAALASLQAARGYLERAEHDKGGWRAAAKQATDTAITETKRGIAFDNHH